MRHKRFLKKLKNCKVIIFLGMFGTGKTELAINTALSLRDSDMKTALADIDTISPYFRSRDEKDYLESEGVKVITPPGRLMHADIPMIVPQVGGYIQNRDYRIVLDVGGNDDGATVLGSLNHFISAQDYCSVFVLNRNRPFSDDNQKIAEQIERLSAKARIRIDYLANNTNLGAETDRDTIEKGEAFAEAVSKTTQIPVLFTSMAGDQMDDDETRFERYTIKRFLKYFE